MQENQETEVMAAESDDFDSYMDSTPDKEEPNKADEEPNETGEEVKTDEVKAEEVKAEEVKTEESKSEDESKDAEKEEPTPDKIKVGELEFTESEIMEGRKAFDNLKQWQKNMTEKSQIVSNLTDEQVNKIMTATDHLRNIKMPDEFDTEVKELDLTDDAPFTVEVEDSDGIPVSIDLKPYLKPFLTGQSKQLQALQGKIDGYEGELTTAKQDNALNYMHRNMADFPDLKIDGLTADKIETIIQAGITHPDYDKLMKFKTAAEYATSSGVEFKDAYKRLFAGEIASNKEANRIKRNVEKTLKPEPPAKTINTSEVDDLYENEFGEDVIGKINALP